jgi:hypoxanthine phosphoribosyltransferase
MIEPKIIIGRDEIKQAVIRLARQITSDYRGKEPLLIGILKGSCIFLSDIIREINIPLEIEFVRLASYSGKLSSGKVKIVQGLKSTIQGRDILIVEDIVDTGLSVSVLLKYLKRRAPASLKLCVLLDKPSRRTILVPIDYLGFTVPDKFIVGYGIDWNEKYRYLPDIAAID